MIRAVLCGLVGLASFAADLSGIWVGQLPARFGEVQDVAFKFTQSATSITGKSYGDSESTPIADGKLEGDQLRFRIGNEMNGGQTRFVFTGVVKGDVIELTRERILTPEQANDPTRDKRNLKQTLTLKRLLK